jgi:hypothetical protein
MMGGNMTQPPSACRGGAILMVATNSEVTADIAIVVTIIIVTLACLLFSIN